MTPQKHFKVDWARTAIVLMIFDFFLSFIELTYSERVHSEGLRVLLVAINCVRTALMFVLTGVCVTYIRTNERRQ